MARAVPECMLKIHKFFRVGALSGIYGDMKLLPERFPSKYVSIEGQAVEFGKFSI